VPAIRCTLPTFVSPLLTFLVNQLRRWMPLLEGGTSASPPGVGHPPPRRLSVQFSDLARVAIMTSANSSPASETELPHTDHDAHKDSSLMPPTKTGFGRTPNPHVNSMKPFHPLPQQSHGGVGIALTDTPLPTAPNSPQMYGTFKCRKCK